MEPGVLGGLTSRVQTRRRKRKKFISWTSQQGMQRTSLATHATGFISGPADTSSMFQCQAPSESEDLALYGKVC